MILKHRFRRLKRHFKPTVVFSFLERSNIIAIDANRGDCKTIISVHNNLAEQYKKFGWFKQRLVKALVKKKYNGKADKIIAVSQSIKKSLVNDFNIHENKILVINNYIDPQKILRLSEEAVELEFNPEYFHLITIGRAEYQKAQWKILKALSYLTHQKGGSKFKLLILGDGKYLSRLKQQVSDLKIDHLVYFKGFVSNPFPYLKKSDLLVLPSIYEGFPVVISEAAILQTPFVGSRKAIPIEVYNSHSSWETFTYDNVHTDPDFSTKILSDDILLAELIQTGIHQQDQIIQSSSNWLSENTEKKIFEQYMSL